MKFSFLSMFVFIMLSGCLAVRSNSEVTIMGGEPLSEEDYPAVIPLYQVNGAPCTAVYIRPSILLTAAHCTLTQPLKVVGRVIAKIVRLDESGIPGPLDLALIFLAGDGAAQQTMMIATDLPAGGSDVEMIGYGASEEDGSTGLGVKRKARNKFGYPSDFMIITRNGSDGSLDGMIAPGDSGGPLLSQGKIIGIASGKSTYGSKVYGWFINVTSGEAAEFLKHNLVNDIP